MLGTAGLLVAPQASTGRPAGSHDAPRTSGNQPAKGPHAATTDAGGFGIQLLDAPANERGDPRATRYIVDHLSPGSTIQRRVRVVSHSDQPLSLDVYPAAATVADHTFRFAAGESGNELTGWISLTAARVELAPGAQQDIRATIAVPPDASRGERYGVIWAVGEPDLTGPGNVRQVGRVGVRVYLDVGPGGDPIADFDVGRVTASRDADRGPAIAIEVANTRERALDMTGSATLSEGPAGLGAGPFEVAGGTTLAPGESGTVTIGFPADLPNGPWTLDIDLSSGGVHHTLSSTVTFPNSGETTVAAATSSTPWWVIGGIVALGLLVLGIVLVFALSRSRRVAALRVSGRAAGRSLSH